MQAVAQTDPRSSLTALDAGLPPLSGRAWPAAWGLPAGGWSRCCEPALRHALRSRFGFGRCVRVGSGRHEDASLVCEEDPGPAGSGRLLGQDRHGGLGCGSPADWPTRIGRHSAAARLLWGSIRDKRCRERWSPPRPTPTPAFGGHPPCPASPGLEGFVIPRRHHGASVLVMQLPPPHDADLRRTPSCAVPPLPY
jgi:hypothetical protein